MYKLQAFGKTKKIGKASVNLLISSHNASSISYCIIDGQKYKVSTLILNQILDNN